MTISVTDLDRWQLRFEHTAPLFTDLPRPKGRRSPLTELGASLNNLVDFTAGMGWLPDGTFPVRIDGRTYRFPSHIVKGIHEAVEGAAVQREVTAVVPTSYGDVRLVGIPDYVKGDTVVDLKYTEHYDRSWYMHRAWQRRAYPYMLRQNGTVINYFVYYVIEHSKGKWRKHVIRRAVDIEQYERALVGHIERIVLQRRKSSAASTPVRAELRMGMPSCVEYPQRYHLSLKGEEHHENGVQNVSFSDAIPSLNIEGQLLTLDRL